MATAMVKRAATKLGERMEASSWVKRDQKCIWHPFTQAHTAPPPLPIVRGEGAYLYDEDRKAYLDATSSWWVNLHGHAHPYIAKRIAKQAAELEHVIFAGCTHPQAILLAERLLENSPIKEGRVFYSDNGSTAVEVAIKIALQACGSKKTLLSFEGAYHGDTFGAMAAGRNSFNRPFWPYLFEVHTILPPLPGQEEESWKAFQEALAIDEIAAFIFEPGLQGVGGMRRHSLAYLEQMIQACHQKNIITIADEVMTGFGRTGPFFVSSSFEESPDMLCLAKGITGGFLPLGATLVKEFLFEAFLSEDTAKALLHGHSYTANPLACAAANASLDLLLENGEERKRIESLHKGFQKRRKDHPKLLRCEVMGTLLIIEYKSEQGCYFDPLGKRLSAFFLEKGILVRPFGNVLYISPPYCMTTHQLQKIYSTIVMTLENEI